MTNAWKCTLLIPSLSTHKRRYFSTGECPGCHVNRLAALDEVTVADGPWLHRLTDDRDIGVRCCRRSSTICRFWRGGQRLARVVVVVLCVLPYVVYSWLIFPVLMRGLLRMLSGRSTCAKTAGGPIDLISPPSTAGAGNFSGPLQTGVPR